MIPQQLLNAIGLRCCDVQIDSVGTLRFGLGDKVYYSQPKLQGKFHGEWDFLSSCSAWRMLKDQKFICGSLDFREESGHVGGILVGEQLTGIIKPTPFDLSLIFSNELQVNIFGQSGSDGSLEVLAPNDLYLELIGGIWSIANSKEAVQRRNTEEEAICDYIERCKQEVTFCCERLKEVYTEDDSNHNIFVFTPNFDETQWYIPVIGHIYFCPFCGSKIAGTGFGHGWKPINQE